MMKKLQLIKKRVRKSTIFFLIFAFMANAFAWFIYSNKVSGTITTGVKSWKINFKEDGVDLTNNIEFKRELPSDHKKYLKTVVAFANGFGGKIVFGIEDGSLEIV